jgi:hypothetical protein
VLLRRKSPKTLLKSKLASLEHKQDDASPQAKSSVVPNNSQEAGGESTTSEKGLNDEVKIKKKKSIGIILQLKGLKIRLDLMLQTQLS